MVYFKYLVRIETVMYWDINNITGYFIEQPSSVKNEFTLINETTQYRNLKNSKLKEPKMLSNQLPPDTLTIVYNIWFNA